MKPHIDLHHALHALHAGHGGHYGTIGERRAKSVARLHVGATQHSCFTFLPRGLPGGRLQIVGPGDLRIYI